MSNQRIVILGSARTPLGNFLGSLKEVSAPELAAIAIEAAVSRSGLHSEDISEVYMGCVLAAGLGQAPARQAALKAGLPLSVNCTTINKVCGSGMKAVMMAFDSLKAHDPCFIVSGGMESMSNAPYLLKKARQGYRINHSTLYDHMSLDGLEDAYETHCAMGVFADRFAKTEKLSREMQDSFAKDSLELAQKAILDKSFEAEIVPVKLPFSIMTTDEHPARVHSDKIPLLKPVFDENGSVTAANSSSIADGAAALVLSEYQFALEKNLKPIAEILAHTSFAKAPAEFTSAPIDAIQQLLTKLHWTVKDVDLFEINEAFAVVPLACLRALNIPREKINIHGGSCALGHPIGASGARIIVTLIHALKQSGLKRGIAAICIGGGEATAIALEIL